MVGVELVRIFMLSLMQFESMTKPTQSTFLVGFIKIDS